VCSLLLRLETDIKPKIINTNQILIPTNPNLRSVSWMKTKDQWNDETNKGTIVSSYS